MKKTRPSPGLLNAVRKDPHGDTQLVQVNPHEIGMLLQMGGAGVRNPKTGLLQFYPAGAMGGGSDPGGDRNGPMGRSGNGIGGGNGGNGGGNPAGPMMSADALQGWGAGQTDVPNNKAQIARGKFDPDNIGPHETYGYYGSPPTAMQNTLSGLGRFLGIGYHPNAMNVGVPGFNEVQSRVSLDPLGIALGASGLVSPLGTAASLAYKAANLMGFHAPQVGFNVGGTMSGPQAAQTANAGVLGAGGKGDPVGNAIAQNQQQQQAALQASTGQSINPSTQTANPAALGLANLQQPSQSGEIVPGYGYSIPGYGYLAWR